MPPRPAVFLDRDDTLIANRAVTAGTGHEGDLWQPELVRLLPGVAEGCALLKRAGFALVIVSNQGCIARGLCSVHDVARTNRRTAELIRLSGGAEIDAVRFCPYHPAGIVPVLSKEHPWRKPAPGMLLDAAASLELDLARSWLIGDGERDRAAAIAAGIPALHALIVQEGEFLGAAERIVRA